MKMVRRSRVGLLAEVGHLEGPQISGFLFVAFSGINRRGWRGGLGSLQREPGDPTARAFVLLLAFTATIHAVCGLCSPLG